MDEARRAYAVLGLPMGASLAQVRKRYRALVRTWHPDRFAADPQGQAEATLRMQAINAAYKKLLRRLQSAKRAPFARRSKAQDEHSERRLTREEIDAMVEAIGTEGPLDGFLGAVGWIGSTIEGIFAAVFAVAFVVRLTMIVFSRDWAQLRDYPEVAVILGIAIILGLREYLQRRALASAIHKSGKSTSTS